MLGPERDCMKNHGSIFWTSKICTFPGPLCRVKIARIVNAVHCHSWLSDNNHCHEFKFSIVRIVIISDCEKKKKIKFYSIEKFQFFENCRICYILSNLSKIVKFVKNCQICQKKLSKLSIFFKHCQNFQFS